MCVCVWRAGHYITVWWKTGGDKLGVLGGGGTSIIRELHRERKRYGKEMERRDTSMLCC